MWSRKRQSGGVWRRYEKKQKHYNEHESCFLQLRLKITKKKLLVRDHKQELSGLHESWREVGEQEVCVCVCLSVLSVTHIHVSLVVVVSVLLRLLGGGLPWGPPPPGGP